MKAKSVILALFCCLLVAVNVGLITQIRSDLATEPSLPALSEDAPEAKVRPADLSPAEKTAVFSIPPVESYKAIVERPLFSKDRRAALQSSTASSSGMDLQATLVGIISTSTKSLVLMRLDDTGEVIQLLEGDRVKGWMLVSVSQQQAIFENNGEELTLDLAFESDLNWGKPKQREFKENEAKPPKEEQGEAQAQPSLED